MESLIGALIEGDRASAGLPKAPKLAGDPPAAPKGVFDPEPGAVNPPNAKVGFAAGGGARKPPPLFAVKPPPGVPKPTGAPLAGEAKALAKGAAGAPNPLAGEPKPGVASKAGAPKAPAAGAGKEPKPAKPAAATGE